MGREAGDLPVGRLREVIRPVQRTLYMRRLGYLQIMMREPSQAQPEARGDNEIRLPTRFAKPRFSTSLRSWLR